MFATDFDYYRAGSVAEAGQLLQAHPGAKLLAGGHSLIPLLKLRLAAPAAVIDIGRIGELKGITVSGDTLKIGALTTHAELAASAAVRQHAAALAEAAGQIGDPAVRNRGTVGGNVAHADPASDLPTVLSALGATFGVVSAGGERTIDAAEFFQGIMTTALGENDLLTSIELPVAHAGQGSAYVKFAHPASRYAVIGVAASVSISNGSCASAAVAIGGFVPTPCRAASVEQALTGQALTLDVIATASQAVSSDVGDDLLGDILPPPSIEKQLRTCTSDARSPLPRSARPVPEPAALPTSIDDLQHLLAQQRRLMEASGSLERTRATKELFGDDFLIKRPLLLQALISNGAQPPVLLIDELDRADEEFEGFLLELLSDFQVTIPEIGTIRAEQPPTVVIASNRTRELHDALKRRCLYYWIDYPDYDKELEIVMTKVPGVRSKSPRLCRSCAQPSCTRRLGSQKRSIGWPRWWL